MDDVIMPAGVQNDLGGDVRGTIPEIPLRDVENGVHWADVGE